jgi:hypothetical protein
MSTQTINPLFAERRKHKRKIDLPKDYGWTMYMIAITLLMVTGYIISREHLYKAGDRIGYNLGLAGGLMMLSLLLYPLRKRVEFMKNWIVLPKWFQWHMVFGVLGPALIMFHSTFEISSINSGAALIATMVVSGSGIFGRFFYTKVHMGLYGRQASHQLLQKELDGYGDVKSNLSFAPGIQRKLAEFRDYATNSSKNGKLKLWNFLTVGMRARLLSHTLTIELEDTMYADAAEKNWNEIQMRDLDELFHQSRTFIQAYLNAIQDLAQFETYEKLFSLWNILHVPPVYILVFAGAWHVIAVHMY